MIGQLISTLFPLPHWAGRPTCHDSADCQISVFFLPPPLWFLCLTYPVQLDSPASSIKRIVETLWLGEEKRQCGEQWFGFYSRPRPMQLDPVAVNNTFSLALLSCVYVTFITVRLRTKRHPQSAISSSVACVVGPLYLWVLCPWIQPATDRKVFLKMSPCCWGVRYIGIG